MNHLAHVFLSGKHEDILIGNFITDFINNKEVKSLSISVQKGVELHYLIDEFTDNHPIVKKSVKRLRPLHRKYSPVVMDIYFDYLLANNWNAFSEISLESFTTWVYKILLARMEEMPPHLKRYLPKMIQDDWLSKYKEEIGLRRAFKGIKSRSSKPEQMDNATEHLFQFYDLFQEEFLAFFPELMVAVKNKLDTINMSHPEF